MTPSKTDKEAMNFEKDLERLEQLVAELEEGGLSLEDAMKRFEEGVRLERRCRQALETAEKKIERLTREADGTLTTAALDGEADEDDNGGGAPPRPKAKRASRPAEDAEDAEEDGEMLF